MNKNLKLILIILLTAAVPFIVDRILEPSPAQPEQIIETTTTATTIAAKTPPPNECSANRTCTCTGDFSIPYTEYVPFAAEHSLSEPIQIKFCSGDQTIVFSETPNCVAAQSDGEGENLMFLLDNSECPLLKKEFYSLDFSADGTDLNDSFKINGQGKDTDFSFHGFLYLSNPPNQKAAYRCSCPAPGT